MIQITTEKGNTSFSSFSSALPLFNSHCKFGKFLCLKISKKIFSILQLIKHLPAKSHHFAHPILFQEQRRNNFMLVNRTMIWLLIDMMRWKMITTSCEMWNVAALFGFIGL